MIYQRFNELPGLVDKKLVTRRPHPFLPIDIYNYTVGGQFTPIVEWTEAMKDCRGLILDRAGEIVGRTFKKFWSYEQVLGQIPSEPFTVWEKLDGSLGIICEYAGELVCATRGSFESDQAKWLTDYMRRHHKGWLPGDVTFLAEIIFPENRIVVDYGDREEPVLLAVMSKDGVDLPGLFEGCTRFRKAQRFDLQEFSRVSEDPQFAGQEGFVVKWQSGFMAKVKLEEYKRLHKLITQCSTRTIWEMMRVGSDTQELLDRVPSDFEQWARDQIHGISTAHANIRQAAMLAMESAPPAEPRKDFAMWAKQQQHQGLLFSLLDGRDITDAIWKLVEPKWATPFKKDVE